MQTTPTSKIFTIETRLSKCDNAKLLAEFETDRVVYGKAFRYTWHCYRKGGKFPVSKAKFNTMLQNRFGISKRFANSVISDVRGRYHALKELKIYERNQLFAKIETLEDKLSKFYRQVDDLKEPVAKNLVTEAELKGYKTLKEKAFYLTQCIHKKRRKLKDLEEQLKTKCFSLCFGSRRLFHAQYHLKENNFTSHKVWLDAFRKQRDNRILFVGSKEETSGNQMFQLTPLSGCCFMPSDYEKYQDTDKKKWFLLKVRKNTKERGVFLNGICSFSYMGSQLIDLLAAKVHGVSYRIIYRGSKCYLQAMLNIDSCGFVTGVSNGTVGLDYNEGFIELSETDDKGNLVAQKHYDLNYHGMGSKAENEMRQTAASITDYALQRGKSLVIENLNFQRTKGKTVTARSKSGKKYNRMIHAFGYSRYKECFEGSCFKKQVELIKVNPAYTSKIAKQKYCNSKHMNVHQGASYVIARRGQGYKDNLVA